MNKKIGIVGWNVGDNSFGLTKAYQQFWMQFGELIIIHPYEKEARDLDLLVLPGGPDVNPLRYLDENEDIHPLTGLPRMEFEQFDKILLPKYIAKQTKIFCTCRGMQSLYVHFGGKLNQHMYHETNTKDRSELVHGVIFENTQLISGLDEVLVNVKEKSTKNKPKKDKDNYVYKINSLHHQSVNEDTKPETFTILARHDWDDTIEIGTFYPHYPAHLTQHHLEETLDPASIHLVKHLLYYI